MVGDWELIHASRPAFGSSAVPGAEDVFVSEELDERLHAAIVDLDPRFRAAIVLVDVHDLSYAEAAAVLDVPVGTVMSRLSRGKDLLRQRLTGNLEGAAEKITPLRQEQPRRMEQL